MAKPEWGAKHRCTSCDKSFYDMLRNPIICPSCGAEHVPEKLLKPGKAVAAEPKPKAKPKVVKPVDGDDEDSEESSVSRLLDDDEILAEEDIDLDDDDDDDSDLGVVVRPSKDDEL